MHYLLANLSALIIMINTGMWTIPIIIMQKQQYCVGMLTVWIHVNVYSYWYYLILSLAVQNAFNFSLSTFHWLISVGFVLQCFLVHWPSLTFTLKPRLPIPSLYFEYSYPSLVLPCPITTLPVKVSLQSVSPVSITVSSVY